MISVYFSAYASHLLQSLNVELFDSVQYIYKCEIIQLFQLKIIHIFKKKFLDILTNAQSRVYISENIASVWRESDIELYNFFTILKWVFRAFSVTSFSASFISALLQTLRSAAQIDNILSSFFNQQWSSKLIYNLILLIKKMKITLFTFIILQKQKKNLLRVNTHHLTQKRRFITTKDEFLTSIRAAKLCRITDKENKRELNAEHLCQLQMKRLSALQAKSLLKRKKRLSKKHLMILPVVRRQP